ncbi:Asp23/Gls24 family envelope stress response protein [Streptomyces lavendulae]|uniref:Asp23/Gls24 family envelope stress response protein n=1 Tax=Streptomyces lavendulae TaxID=1914 RepID=UPI0036C8089B
MAMSESREPRTVAGAEAGDMGMDVGMDVDVDTVLPCGRDLARLWDGEDRDGRATAGQGEDPHTADCPHCGAALAELALLRGAAVHRGQEADTDWEASAARLTASIMDVVRLELRPGRPLALGEMDEDTWIHEAAAARTFRSAAERVPGVRAGSCRISPEPPPRPGARTPARVRIEVTVGMGRDVQPVADRIRRTIATCAEQALGLQITSIDVVVVDLHDESPAEDPQ